MLELPGKFWENTGAHLQIELTEQRKIPRGP
jgi:hypothetical protein